MKVYSTIYQLSDDSGCRYVGQTISPLSKRRADHVSASLRGERTYKANWIVSVLKGGGDVYISEIESGVWTQAQRDEREQYWIAEYKRQGHKLTNLTDGGYGHVPDEEERAYISQKTREAMARPEVRAKIKKLQSKECPVCLNVYEPKKSRDKTCSFDCGQKLAAQSRTGTQRVVKTSECAVCNRQFEKSKASQVTCSTRCAGTLRGMNGAKPYSDGLCSVCNKNFQRSRRNRTRTTCSEKCRYIRAASYRQGTKNG